MIAFYLSADLDSVVLNASSMFGSTRFNWVRLNNSVELLQGTQNVPSYRIYERSTAPSGAQNMNMDWTVHESMNTQSTN